MWMLYFLSVFIDYLSFFHRVIVPQSIHIFIRGKAKSFVIFHQNTENNNTDHYGFREGEGRKLLNIFDLWTQDVCF